MKIFTTLTFVLLSFLMFTACDNEPIDSAIDIATINQGPEPVVLNCTETTQALASASLNFANADSSNYLIFCTAYKTALQNQITACGDTEEVLQELINELGDCSYDDTDIDCSLTTSAAQTVLDALNSATEDNYSTICNTYKGALQNQIDACGDVDGSIQDSIDVLGDCTWSGGSTTVNSFYAEVDGVEYNYGFLSAVGVATFNNITIGAVNIGSNEMSIIMPLDITPGTYSYSQVISSFNWEYKPNSSNTLPIPETLVLTIITHDTGNRNISGTFSWDCTEVANPSQQYSITNGEFSVHYL